VALSGVALGVENALAPGGLVAIGIFITLVVGDRHTDTGFTGFCFGAVPMIITHLSADFLIADPAAFTLIPRFTRLAAWDCFVYVRVAGQHAHPSRAQGYAATPEAS
jgi:hypothetical protein